MASFKNEQRRLTLHGRSFHFISYEAQDANPNKKIEAIVASWYLVSSTSRWPAIPLEPGTPDEELDARLMGWLAERVTA